MTAAATAGSANSKLARFRQLLDAKRLHEEATTPSSLFETTPLPRSASPPGATTSSQKSSAGAKSWPMHEPRENNSKSRGVSMDLNDELEKEHQHQRGSNNATASRTAGKGGKLGYKENLCPNNFSAMKKIMERKQMANAARKELDSSADAATSSREKKSNETTPVDDGGVVTSSVEKKKATMNNRESLSLDQEETSVWAMLSNHLNESTLDQEQSSELAITPARWMQQTDVSDGGGDGSSGVLSFLGESPLFDKSVTEENEAERNLVRSAEKVKNLEERLLRSADGILSPVEQPKGGERDSVQGEADNHDDAAHRDKEVTFAIQDGWKTPRGPSNYSSYRKSPYVAKSPYADEKTTPSSKLSESMEAQANPMNESAIVSDDEASGENNVIGSPSPMKGIGADDKDVTEDAASEDQRWDKEFGAGLSPEDDGDSSSQVYSSKFDAPESNGTDMELVGMGSPKSRGPGKQRHRSGGSKQANATPTRALLMERNQTLVKEVRFADQTCVELSERKKYYKNQAGQFKKTLSVANKENSLLRVNYELSLQESSKLKVLVESLQAQKHQAELQVEAYRTQITESEKAHSSVLKKMENTYHSHLRNSEEQIISLNERLRQSDAANATLQSKLDEVHGKWESKLQSDAASKELIASLKERIVASDTLASTKDASAKAMQARIDNLQNMQDQHANQLRRERNEREMIEQDRDELQAQCDSLHKQLTEWVQTSDTLGDVFFDEDGSQNEDFTPVKRLCLDSSASSSGGSASCSGNNGFRHPRTPTSNLLARTLRSELKRRQTVAEKLESAERKVAKLNEKLSDMKMDVEEAKADNALIEEDLEEKCAQIAELEVALGEKDDRIARLNEELEVLIQVEAGGVASAACDESCSRRSADSGERGTASIEERLDAVEETLEYTDAELVETKARLEDTQELLDQTASELEKSEEELAKALDQVANYEAQLSRSDTVNVELRTQLNSCFQSLVSLEKILRTYEDIDGLVGKRMSEQSRKISRLLGTMEQFVQERSALPTRDLESGTLALMTNEELRVKESGLEDLASMSSSSSYEARRSTWSTHYQEQLDELRKEVAAVEVERDDANKQLQKAHGFLQEFRNELSKQESEHAQETTSLKKDCEELEGKLSAVTLDLQTCQKENQSLFKNTATADNEVSQQLSVIRSNNAELIQENETLRVDLEAFQLQIEDEKALLRATREETDGYRQDVSNAKAAFECLTTECDLQKASMTKLEKEAQGLREAIAQKDKNIKDYQESLSKAQASFQEQSELLKSRCDDLEAKLSAEEKGRLVVEASLDDASRHIAMLEDTIKTREEECKEKEKECQELIVSLKQVQNALGEAEKERGDAANTIESLEVQIQEKTSVLFAYEEAIIGYKDDIRRLNNELQTTVLEKNNRIQMLEQGLTSRQTLFTEQLDRTKEERDASTAELTDMIERLQNELQSSNKSHQESVERAKRAITALEEEQSEVLKDLKKQIVREQGHLEEKTQKLREAHNEIARVTDRLNLLEMDCERMLTKHQDEAEELVEERNRLESEKNQFKEHVRLLQANIEDVEETRDQQRDEIDGLVAHNASLQKKCNIFKDKVKSLSEKNKAWEESYKNQSNDLVLHGMEISRLNGRVSDLKSKLIRQGSGHYVNRSELPSSAHTTPQGGGSYYLRHPSTM